MKPQDQVMEEFQEIKKADSPPPERQQEEVPEIEKDFEME
jgi:hypothetical protein